MRTRRRRHHAHLLAALGMSALLAIPTTAAADPLVNNAEVPTVQQTTDPATPSPGSDTTTPSDGSDTPSAPSTPVQPSEPTVPSEPGSPSEPGAPESQTPSTAPTDPSAPSSVPAPGRRVAPQAVTAGCQTYPPTTFQVCGRIRDKYNQTGGPAGFLLFPKSNELTNPGNTGKRSEFLGGNIYWSAATDAHPVAHEFLTKWGEKGYETGYLKYPTTDEIVLSDGINRRQEYQGGSIYWAAGIGAHTIQGAIRDKWRAMGAEKSALGFPTSDEKITPDGKGRYNTFQNGSIYWSPTTGAHPVNGPILDQWSQDGYESGKWGYPVSDQVIDLENDRITQGFQRGTIGVGNAQLRPVPASGTVEACSFIQKADNVHLSTSEGPTVLHGKGWWQNVDCPAYNRADVRAQLQSEILTGPVGRYQDVGEMAVSNNAESGSKARRAIARYDCPPDEPGRAYLWRVAVDVDIVGHPDTPGITYSKVADLPCRPDFLDPVSPG